MALKEKKTILAIETSCDETAAAVLSVDDEKGWPKITTLSSVIKSQIKLHSKMGGVVPEAAARAHTQWIRPVVEKALSTKHLALSTIDYIAVTAGPGLISSLMVGVEFARGLSFATGKPIIPVNHLLGHLYSPLGRIFNFQFSIFKKNLKSPPDFATTKSLRAGKILNPKSIFPIISLIVSGGHTILTLMKNEKEYRVLGQTVDDAAGEAFDKVAKLLRLPYPGGPALEKLALSLPKGRKPSINFPRPMINQKNYNFSFAGLKTSVLYYLRDHITPSPPLKIRGEIKAPPLKIRGGWEGISKSDVCASFQQAAVDVLVAKTLRAAKEFKARSISLSGGVSANKLLRDTLRNQCKKNNLRFFVPPLKLTTDNAEMIGLAAAFMLRNGFKPVSFKKVQADSNLSL